ncbi:hypothetical protein LTR15_009971 [Elasticomyces elasticus]|nr:hypothetical protein LTR15_009971 [Elasticomyces elasticus]
MSICLRCLKRALVPELSSSRAAFSTSATLSANPTKKKAVVPKTLAKAGRTLRLAKNKRVVTARPPAAGERKALRKKVVLSNTNALEVPGLAELSTDTVRDGAKLKALEGKVVGFGTETVDALRCLEGFKPGQGWHLFRRPAALLRKDGVEMGEAIQRAREEKTVERRVVFGDKGSGKSVLLLQSMAMAYLQGWVVIHFPEARDITIAQTPYEPVQTADGKTAYVQPRYIASILSNIAAANRALLNDLRITQQHNLPIPLQSNISLTRLVELGANDAQLAWPIWQAFLSEITAPSQPEKQGGLRPPIFVGMDGVDHIMRMSAYLDTEMKSIHAHDLAIAQSFTAMLSGKTHLANGGMIMAATSGSTRPSVPTLDHFLARAYALGHAEPLKAMRDALLEQTKVTVYDGDLAPLEQLNTSAMHPEVAAQVLDLKYGIHHLQENDASLEKLQGFLQRFKVRLPKAAVWDAYLPKDENVVAVMESGVRVTKVAGLSKDEARSVMEYYARSGMLRGSPVTEGLVGEKWTLAGGGIIGELEKGTVAIPSRQLCATKGRPRLASAPAGILDFPFDSAQIRDNITALFMASIMTVVLCLV